MTTRLWFAIACCLAIARATAEPATDPATDLTLATPHGFLAGRFEPLTDRLALLQTTLSIYLPPPVVADEELNLTLKGALTALDGGDVDGLPAELYDLTVEADWRTKLNDAWSLALGLTAGYHGDLDATREAWRLSVRAIGTYTASDEWKILAGLIASTRSDLPLLPVLGAIWSPTDSFRASFTMPTPRVAWKVNDTDTAQHWVYLEGQFGSSSWAYEAANGEDEILRYQEKRAVIGIESRAQPRLVRGPRPLNWYLEAGYAFDREVIVETPGPDIEPDGAFVIAAGFMF